MCCIPAVAIPLLIVSIVISALLSKPQISSTSQISTSHISKPYIMNIPIDIPRRINPEILDPISKSVVYYVSTDDAIIDDDGDILFRFPYSKDTFWTNFKYSYYGNKELLEIGIKLVTSNGYSYEVAPQIVREKSVWEDTIWPLPSINTENGGIYLKIKHVADIKYKLSISLLGFMDIFPKVDNYLLLSPLDTYQFVFSKVEYNDPDLATGSIYSIEHFNHIHNIINKSYGVQLIKRY